MVMKLRVPPGSRLNALPTPAIEVAERPREPYVLEVRVAEPVAKEFGDETRTEPAQVYGHVLSEGDAPADRPLPLGRAPVLADSVRRS